MSRELIIVAHGQCGHIMRNEAALLLGSLPVETVCVAVPIDSDPERIHDFALQQVREDAEHLIITDLFGSTPSNVAHRLGNALECDVVHGLNLAMLMRAFNYSEAAMEDWIRCITEGGRRAIFAGDAPE